MEKLDTSNVDYWPDGVILGSAEITGDIPLSVLTEKERVEFEGFISLKRKAEFLSARHLFHFLLGEINLQMHEVELFKEDKGKPYAKSLDKIIHVSFSHSPNRVFCALSPSHIIGVDVEAVDRKINPEVVKRILNENEWNQIGSEVPVKLWTIKEAAVKCLGTGLRTNLQELTIIKKEKNRFSVRFNNEKLFEICSFQQSDHQIALAYQSKHI